MKMQKILAAAVTLLLVSTGAAFATTVNVGGSYTITLSGFDGNLPGIATPGTPKLSTISGASTTYTGTLPSTMTLGTTSTYNFFTAEPSGTCGSNCTKDTEGSHHYYTDTGTISVTFNFTNLTPVAGSVLTETGTYEAKYGGAALGCTSSSAGDTDCILWGSTTKGNQAITDVIDFTNGDVLTITLDDAQDWNITPEISFDLTQPTATPLPPAVALFAGGLGMFGYLGARKKRKSTALVG